MMDSLLRKLENEYIGKYDCRLKHILEEYSIPEVVSHIISWLSIEWTNKDNLTYAEILIIARDFYIGSDLSPQQKSAYYAELKHQNFFQKLETHLYSTDKNQSSWAIYTIGKFSEKENSIYLENAYEKRFRSNNPILASRCLSELSWLGSKKVKKYLTELKSSNSILSKLTLLLYGDTNCNPIYINSFIHDTELMNFVSPKDPNLSKEEVIQRINHFEMHFFNASITPQNRQEFSEFAKNYFDKY